MPLRATSNSLTRADLLGFLEVNPSDLLPITLEIFLPFATQDVRGSYNVLPVGVNAEDQNVDRSRKSGYPTGDFRMTEKSYRCRTRGWKEVEDEEDLAQYGKYGDYEKALVTRARNIVLQAQEARAVAICHNTTTFPQSGNTGLAVGVEWDTAATATPIDDVAAAKTGSWNRCGREIDAMQISRTTWSDLWTCDQVRQSLKYVMAMEIPDPSDLSARQTMAKTLGLKHLLIGNLPYNTANEGLTVTLGNRWSAEYAFCFYRGMPSPTDISAPTFGRCFHWAAGGGLLDVRQYYDDNIEANAYRVKQCVDERAHMEECGFLMSNIHT